MTWHFSFIAPFHFLLSRVFVCLFCLQSYSVKVAYGEGASEEAVYFYFLIFIFLFLLEDNYFTILWWSLKKQKHHFAVKGPYSESYSFSNSRVWMWEVDHKEGWALKNWCFPIVVLEKTLESPLDCKEIKSVNPKGNQPWILKYWC